MRFSSHTVDNHAELNIGCRLKEVRNAQGLSIRALARISGLNFNTLSLIENGKTSPNVNTLQQIALALKIPITVFFETDTISGDVIFQKSGQRTKTSFLCADLEDLGGGLALGEATPLMMMLKPNSNSGKDTIIHTGQEFIYCLEGSLIYFVGEGEFRLDPDDSLIFQAHIPHRWENRTDNFSKALLIICPSDHSDRSVEQHLAYEGIPDESQLS
jgi:transcriptional regulator with XRE-family HTH domain